MAYLYTVDPAVPNGVTATTGSNVVDTTVFRHNFGQPITDLIDSMALEQATLAQAVGAKIQKMVAMLEAVLKQKCSIVHCQISGSCM